MKKLVLLIFFALLVTSCSKADVKSSAQDSNENNLTQAPLTNDLSGPTLLPTKPVLLDPTPVPILKIASAPSIAVPNFDHIIIIVLENKDYSMVMGSKSMPYLNTLAKENVLLSNYFAVTHPSLPNYIALISGGTQDITKNCNDCFIDGTNLADLIEESGRTWKTYQEDLPSPCFIGDAKPYYQKHNPFIYFDSIRLNAERCNNSIVPLTQLDKDLTSKELPNFSFIMPNICNSAHDCSRKIADQWVADMISKIQVSTVLGEKNLIVVTFDEASDTRKESCCGMGKEAGGQIYTVLISPQAKTGYVDDTPYSHFSLLKTILSAWDLPDVGNTSQNATSVILNPWK